MEALYMSLNLATTMPAVMYAPPSFLKCFIMGSFERLAFDLISNMGELSTCLIWPSNLVAVSLLMMLSGVTPRAFASVSREFITFMAAFMPLQSWKRTGRLSWYAYLGASNIGDTGLLISVRLPSFFSQSKHSRRPIIPTP